MNFSPYPCPGSAFAARYNQASLAAGAGQELGPCKGDLERVRDESQTGLNRSREENMFRAFRCRQEILPEAMFCW